MNPKKLAKQYLEDKRVMQLATVSGNQPWISNVYYVADDNMCLYWMSLPTRRHSLEIAQNPKVAVAIAVKLDQPVIGIQAEGIAEVVTNKDEVEKISKKYVAKHGTGHEFYENFLKGTNMHQLYRFTPKSLLLWDEQNFPENSHQQII